MRNGPVAGLPPVGTDARSGSADAIARRGADKPARRPVHGVLLLDKPLGISSNHALQRAKRLLRAQKAGHTGTLDPQASGLLPLCFGAATKFSQVSLDADKAYRATLQLGQRSDTGDGEGQISAGAAPAFDRAALDAACAALTGAIDAGAADALGAEEGRPAAVRLRARRPDGRTHRRAGSRCTGSTSSTGRTTGSCSTSCAARAPTSARWRPTWATRWAAAPGCGPCAAPPAGRWTWPRPSRWRRWKRWTSPRATPACCRPTCCWPTGPLLRLPDDEAGRFLTGLRRRVAAPDAPAVRVYASSPSAGCHRPPNPRAFLGSAHITAGELIADRLLSPLEVHAIARVTTA